MPNFQANLTNLKRIVFPGRVAASIVIVCARVRGERRGKTSVRGVCEGVERQNPTCAQKVKCPWHLTMCEVCEGVSVCLFALHLCTCVQTEKGRESGRGRVRVRARKGENERAS